MRSYWDERAQLNAAWYVDTTLDYDDPDVDRFLATGEQIASFALDGAPKAPLRSGVALEIGAGLGRVCLALSRRFSAVLGVDVSEEMLSRARDIVEAPNVAFMVTDGQSLAALRDASVDLVLTFTVLQHIPHQKIIEGYVSEIGRVLRPGGLAVLQWNDRARLPWSIRRRVLTSLAALGLRNDPYGRYAPEFLGTPVPYRRMARWMEDAGMTIP
jgi:SAM-dependent methyltransferase